MALIPNRIRDSHKRTGADTFSLLDRLRERVFLADPGLASMRRAIRAIVTILAAVFTTYALVSALAPIAAIPAALLAGMVGLFATFAVNDPAVRGKALTLALFALVAACALTLGSLVSASVLLTDVCLILVLFLAFASRRFGARFTPLGMGAFVGFYFAALLRVQLVELPLLLIGVGLGAGWGLILLPVVFPDDPRRAQTRLTATFFADAAALVGALHRNLDMLGGELSRPVSLRRALARLSRVEVDLAKALADADEEEGRSAERESLAYFLADVLISLETLVESTVALASRGLLVDPLRARVSALCSALERALWAQAVRGHALTFVPLLTELLDPSSFNALPEPERARRLTHQMALAVRWLADDPTPDEIARRDDVAGAGERAGGVSQTSSLDAPAAEAAEVPTAPGGLDPSMRQAIQGVLAGTASILVGHAISPAHPYWALLTAFVVLSRSGSVGVTYVRAAERLLGTLAGAVVGFSLAWVVAGSVSRELALLFASVFLAVVLFSTSYALMVFFITIMLALLYDVLLGHVTLPLIESRVVNTLVGAISGVLAARLVLPTRTSDEVRDKTQHYFSTLTTYLSLAVGALLTTDSSSRLLPNTQALRDALADARTSLTTLRRQPGTRSRNGAERMLTAIVESSYYARRLTDPVARRMLAAHIAPDASGSEVVCAVLDNTCANLEVLCATLEGKRGHKTLPLLAHGALLDRHYSAFTGLEAAQIANVGAGADPAGMLRDVGGGGREDLWESALLSRTAHYLWHIDRAVERLAADLGAGREPM